MKYCWNWKRTKYLFGFFSADSRLAVFFVCLFVTSKDMIILKAQSRFSQIPFLEVLECLSARASACLWLPAWHLSWQPQQLQHLGLRWVQLQPPPSHQNQGPAGPICCGGWEHTMKRIQTNVWQYWNQCCGHGNQVQWKNVIAPTNDYWNRAYEFPLPPHFQTKNAVVHLQQTKIL